MLTLKKGSALRVRYLIKYNKGAAIKFVSHLDMMRNIQRTFKRSGLPTSYSQGFNPHMKLSIAQPLSVGVYSEGEYMDVEFDEEVAEAEIRNRFNAVAPEDIKIIDVLKIDKKYYDDGKKIEQSMAAVMEAKYSIKMKYKDTTKLTEELENELKKAEWMTLKKSKSGEKMVNIRPMVKKFAYTIENNVLNIDALVACGSRENLSPELICNYLKDNTLNANLDAFCEVKREEMYGIKNKSLISLFKFFKNL